MTGELTSFYRMLLLQSAEADSNLASAKSETCTPPSDTALGKLQGRRDVYAWILEQFERHGLHEHTVVMPRRSLVMNARKGQFVRWTASGLLERLVLKGDKVFALRLDGGMHEIDERRFYDCRVVDSSDQLTVGDAFAFVEAAKVGLARDVHEE